MMVFNFFNSFMYGDVIRDDENRSDWKEDTLNTIHTQREKVETYVRINWRQFSLPFHMQRAHFVGDEGLIRQILRQNRNDQRFSFGSEFDGLGVGNMLTCPFKEHARLRKPLGAFLKTSNVKKEMAKEIATTIISLLSFRNDLCLDYDHIVFMVIVHCVLGFDCSQADMEELYQYYQLLNGNSIKTFFSIRLREQGCYRQGKAIDLLKQAEQKKEMSEEEVISSIATIFIGGIHTTSSFVALWLDEMAACPDVREKILEEWNAFLKEKENSRPLDSLDDLVDTLSSFVSNSQWLEACFLEGVRHHPVVPAIKRTADEKQEIEGVVIAKGDEVYLNVYKCHHDEEIWESPYTFNPQRFIDEPALRSHLLPFSIGAQQCIGKDLAQTESKLLLAILIIFYEWEKKKEKSLSLNYQSFIVRPVDLSYILSFEFLTWENFAAFEKKAGEQLNMHAIPASKLENPIPKEYAIHQIPSINLDPLESLPLFNKGGHSMEKWLINNSVLMKNMVNQINFNIEEKIQSIIESQMDSIKTDILKKFDLYLKEKKNHFHD